MTDNPRKIYNMIRIDVDTGKTIEEDSFLYSGPLALCEGEEGPSEETIAAAREAMAAAGIKGLDEWQDASPEDIRESASLAKFAGKPHHEVTRAYINLEKRMGEKRFALPKENATPEEWDAFYSEVGRPGDVNGYEVGLPEEVPEGFKVSQEYIDDFKAAAHKAGLSKTQAGKVWEFMLDKATGSYKTAVDGGKTRLADEHNALKADWGGAYDERIKTANSVAKKLGGEDLVTFLKTSGIGREPKLIRVFAEMGKYLSADDLGDGGSGSALTPSEAMSKVNAIRSNPDHPYHDRKKPGHKEAVEEVEALYKQAYPDDEV